MVLVVSGVAGSGKTMIGRMLAERLDVPYAEADDFHSEANRLRMAAGLPLSDDDRQPWLAAICDWIAQRLEADESGVVTCSALKRSYRKRLAMPGVKLVFLKVDRETIDSRLEERRGHFFPAALAASQFQMLEEPGPDEDVLVVDGSRPPAEVVSQILAGVAVRSKP
ncbi:MAG TPA: gluconokinase [Candidatus Limnocylindrales bacterium]|nr:gluconokinase [Candidatus Limnocylindrales bacterium]